MKDVRKMLLIAQLWLMGTGPFIVKFNRDVFSRHAESREAAMILALGEKKQAKKTIGGRGLKSLELIDKFNSFEFADRSVYINLTNIQPGSLHTLRKESNEDIVRFGCWNMDRARTALREYPPMPELVGDVVRHNLAFNAKLAISGPSLRRRDLDTSVSFGASQTFTPFRPIIESTWVHILTPNSISPATFIGLGQLKFS